MQSRKLVLGALLAIGALALPVALETLGLHAGARSPAGEASAMALPQKVCRVKSGVCVEGVHDEDPCDLQTDFWIPSS
jgi:hypothetical protein